MTTTFKIRNGDVFINPTNGRPNMIADNVKVSQDVEEMLLIDTQTDNGFGAGLDTMIGQLPSDEHSPGSINFNFGIRLKNAFQNLINLQRSFQFGERPQNETIAKIDIIRAEPDRLDPTKYRFLVRALTVAGTPVQLSGSITL